MVEETHVYAKQVIVSKNEIKREEERERERERTYGNFCIIKE
jgi:hypothetical protein